MAGRVRELLENVDNQPWWRYSAVIDKRTRPAHAALNGKVFRYDDPFWNYFTPPIGCNCRCSVYALSDTALNRLGLMPENGIGRVRSTNVLIGDNTQPQASYYDPTTGDVVKTDIGWGYDWGGAINRYSR